MANTEVFLQGQHSIISKQLKDAKTFILVAMAYFTDASLFALLAKKANEGVKVDLMVLDDDINKLSGIDYASLTGINGEFCYRKHIHNKFCVIDGTTIMSGSYNWTNQAKRNHEDLTLIVDDIRSAAMYTAKFFQIKDPGHFLRRSTLQDSERRGKSSTEQREKLIQRIKEAAQRKQNSSDPGDATSPPDSSK